MDHSAFPMPSDSPNADFGGEAPAMHRNETNPKWIICIEHFFAMREVALLCVHLQKDRRLIYVARSTRTSRAWSHLRLTVCAEYKMLTHPPQVLSSTNRSLPLEGQ